MNPPRIVKNDGITRRIRLVTRQRVEGGEEWEDVDKGALLLQVGIGNPEEPATGGAFSMRYEGSGAGLSGLAWNITEGDLKAALNGNPGVTSGGANPVASVTRGATAIRIVWTANAARAPLEVDVSKLRPRCNVAVHVEHEGGPDGPAIQVIEIRQKLYAFNETWTSYPVGSVSLTQVQAGTAKRAEIQRLQISEPTYKGSLYINFPRPEIVQLTARSNEALKQKFRIRPEADFTEVGDDSQTSLGGAFFDIEDNAGPVRVWMKRTDAAPVDAAPPVPTGGRLLAVNILKNSDKKAVAQALHAALNGDAEFSSEYKVSGTPSARSFFVDVVQANFGSRIVPEDTGGSGFTFTIQQTGNYGRLHQTYFTLYDQNGSVAFWFNVAGKGVIPAGAEAANRAVEITTVNADDTKNLVATAVASAIEGDAEFTASRVNSVVTATDVVGGARENGGAGSTGFGYSVKQDGASITAAVPYDANAKDMAAALSNEFIVTKSGAYTWDFTFKVLGPQPLIEVEGNALYPSGFEGELDCSTYEMRDAMEAAGGRQLDAFLEVKMRYAGGRPLTVLRVPVVVVADVINPASLSSVSSGRVGRNTLPALLTQPQSLLAGEEFVIPDGHDLIVGAGFRVDGVLTANGSGRLIEAGSYGAGNLNRFRWPNTIKRLRGADAPLRLADVGDSVVSPPYVLILGAAVAALGRNGGLGFGVADYFNQSYPAGNPSVTDGTTWHLNFPRLRSGATTVEFGTAADASGILADTLKVYYVARPGGGTFKVQTSTDGGAWTDVVGYTSVSADAGAAAGMVITIAKASAKYRLRAVWVSGGSVDVLGGGIYLSTSRGVTAVSLSEGGSSLDELINVPAAIRDPILTDMSPDCALMQWRDDPAYFRTYLPQWKIMLDTVWPQTDVVMMGTNPISSGDAVSSVEQNAVMAGFARHWHWPYFDTYGVIVDYATGLANGFLLPGGDVHPTAAGYEFIASALWEWLAWFRGTYHSEASQRDLHVRGTLYYDGGKCSGDVVNLDGFFWSQGPEAGIFVHDRATTGNNDKSSMYRYNGVLYFTCDDGFGSAQMLAMQNEWGTHRVWSPNAVNSFGKADKPWEQIYARRVSLVSGATAANGDLYTDGTKLYWRDFAGVDHPLN